MVEFFIYKGVFDFALKGYLPVHGRAISHVTLLVRMLFANFVCLLIFAGGIEVRHFSSDKTLVFRRGKRTTNVSPNGRGEVYRYTSVIRTE